MRNSLIFSNVSVEQFWMLFFICGTFSALSKDALVFPRSQCIYRMLYCPHTVLQHTESISLLDCTDLAFLGERWAQSRICASAAGSVISALLSPSVPPLASPHLCRWHCWELQSNLPDASVFIISLSWESETIVVELFHMRRYKSSFRRHSQTCSAQAHSLPAHLYLFYSLSLQL